MLDEQLELSKQTVGTWLHEPLGYGKAKKAESKTITF
jgi:hypothetical protein